MVQGLQCSDLHLSKNNMFFQIIQKEDIIGQVKKNISLARREILTTMLLKDEIVNPLPASYFNLLYSKIKKGAILKRLGFGRKEDYNKIREKHKFNSVNYKFRYITNELKYQRLILVDRKKLFFGINDLYFVSKHKPLIKIFVDYFDRSFRKGKI